MEERTIAERPSVKPKEITNSIICKVKVLTIRLKNNNVIKT